MCEGVSHACVHVHMYTCMHACACVSDNVIMGIPRGNPLVLFREKALRNFGYNISFIV